MSKAFLKLLVSFLHPSQWQVFHFLALLGFVLFVIGLFWPQLQRWYRLRLLERDLPPEMFAKARFQDWLRDYTRAPIPAGTDYSVVPPGDLFEWLEERLARGAATNPILLLGEAGSGKSAFAVHYYLYLRRRKRLPYHPKLLFLNSPEVEERLANIPNPSETVLILDGLNEDWQAFQSVQNRLAYLMARCARFRQVIFTCRPAFMPEKLLNAPGEDSFIITAPASDGSRVFRFDVLRLPAPDPEQTRRIIARRAGVGRPANRRKIREWRKRNPEWFKYPFLLSRSVAFLEHPPEKHSMFQCYQILEHHWLGKCSWWVDEAALSAFLEELAATIYRGVANRESFFLPEEEVEQLIARQPRLFTPLNKWKLGPEAFLYCDKAGNYSFAHFTFFEYYLMKRFRADKTLPPGSMPWTEVMKRFALEILSDIFAEQGKVDQQIIRGDLSRLESFRFEPVLKLRSRATVVKREEIGSILERYHFFESKWHSSGTGLPACYRPLPPEAPEVVYDNITGLYWQKGGSNSPMHFSRVENYLMDLNESGFGGVSSWRLPTLEEALSLLRPNAGNSNGFIHPLFDQHINAIWTADCDEENLVWMVGFDLGDCSSGDPAGNELYVRAVSDQAPAQPSRQAQEADVDASWSE